MKKRVAIVEDQTAVREMIVHVVHSDPDFEVVAEAGEGQSAIDLCLQATPDLIVLDVMLPGLNGTEVLRRLARQLPRVRVLIFSGFQDAPLLRELLEAGAHGFIGKTASLQELLKGIQIVSSGGSYFSPEIAGALRDAMATPHPGGASLVTRLTAREREILQLIAESNSTKEIATKLGISVKTAENHRTNLMKKLDLHDVASLTRFAIEHQLISPPQRTLV